MGGLSLWHWLVVLVIVVLVFGTKRLKNVGQDLGEAVRGFKRGMQGDDGSDKAGEASKPADAAMTPTDVNPRDDDERNPPSPR